MPTKNLPVKRSMEHHKPVKRIYGAYESPFVDHTEVRDANSPDSGTSSQAHSDLVSSIESMTISSGSIPPKCVTPDGLLNLPPEGWCTFTFELPQSDVGWMIGSKGSFITRVRERSGCTVQVIRHPTDEKLKLCFMGGPSKEQLDEAKSIIRMRFPPKRFPGFSLKEYRLDVPVLAPASPTTLGSEILMPSIQHLTLPVGASFHVVVSALTSPDTLFLQQVTHPSFHHLNVISAFLNQVYGSDESPPLQRPLGPGILCATECEGQWYRCQIQTAPVDDTTDDITVLDLDYGGYYNVNISKCRQIRADLLQYPFQAAEAHMSNIAPVEGVAYTAEVMAATENLLMGTVLTATVVGYHPTTGKPLVELHLENAAAGPGGSTNLNHEMVRLGLARWVE